MKYWKSIAAQLKSWKRENPTLIASKKEFQQNRNKYRRQSKNKENKNKAKLKLRQLLFLRVHLLPTSKMPNKYKIRINLQKLRNKRLLNQQLALLIFQIWNKQLNLSLFLILIYQNQPLNPLSARLLQWSNKQL